MRSKSGNSLVKALVLSSFNFLDRDNGWGLPDLALKTQNNLLNMIFR